MTQLCIVLNDIKHTKTKAKYLQTNGVCEHFHKTILDKSDQIAFRRYIYCFNQELQVDLGEWLAYFINDRTH